MRYASLNFLILTLLVSNILSAQQRQLVLPLPADAGQSAGIQSSPLTTPTGKFELVDLTGDSLLLGYLAVKAGDNERQAIVTPVAKSEWLKAITSANAGSFFAGRTNAILYIINDISVGRTGPGNFVRLKATVYENGVSGYTLLKMLDTLVTDKAKDISSISDLINQAISATANFLKTWIVQPSGKALNRAEVIRQEKEKYTFISNGINPAGIYMSYEEFKTNKPSFGQFFLKTDTTAKTIQVNSFSETDSTLRPVTPWAVAVNNELYLYRGNKLYPVEAVGNNLVFSKFIDPDTRKNNGSFWSMTVGDRLSGKYTNIFDNANMLTLTNYHDKALNGEAVKVNADTGTPEF